MASRSRFQGADAGREGAPAQELKAGLVAKRFEHGDRFVVVVLDFDLYAPDVLGPLAVPSISCQADSMLTSR